VDRGPLPVRPISHYRPRLRPGLCSLNSTLPSRRPSYRRSRSRLRCGRVWYARSVAPNDSRAGSPVRSQMRGGPRLDSNDLPPCYWP